MTETEYFVYFVQAGDDRGPIKIGYTKNLSKRLELLQNGNHLPLRLLGFAPCLTLEIARDNERCFHNLFRELRLRGEWFRWSQSVIDFVAIASDICDRFFRKKVTVEFDLVFTPDDRLYMRPRTGFTNQDSSASAKPRN